MSFENKVVWITGASSGIGEAIAVELAKEGAKLVLSARKVKDLEKVKSNIEAANNEVFVLPIDMLETDTFEQKVAEVKTRFGRIDYLFHNAGISQRGLLKNSPFAVDRQVMEVNFMGVVALTKAVLPVMLSQQSGYFVVTSSISGKVGTPMRSAYSASKHALHGYFDSVRAELWRDNIGVTIVCPGYIKTDISMHAVSDNGAAFGKKDKNQLNGMDVAVCANKIIAAVKAKKHETNIGGKEVLAIYLKKFLPSILFRIVKNYKIETEEN
jgi:short-subunit dehydrogenase